MKKLVLCLLLVFVMLIVCAPVHAAGFQFQSVGFVGAAPVPVGGCGFGNPVFIAAPQPVFVNGFGAGAFQFQQQGLRRGFRRGRGQQIQAVGGVGFGQNIQINQRRGIFGGIRSQQIQSSGPGGSFQLNQ